MGHSAYFKEPRVLHLEYTDVACSRDHTLSHLYVPCPISLDLDLCLQSCFPHLNSAIEVSSLSVSTNWVCV